MTSWTTPELEALEAADDFMVAPFRADGTTLGTPTFIWSVVVDGELYIRAATGQQSSWYQAARTQGAGRIHAAGEDRDVTFEVPNGTADGVLDDAIDTAYRAKYEGQSGLTEMQLPAAVAATVRVSPRRGV